MISKRTLPTLLSLLLAALPGAARAQNYDLHTVQPKLQTDEGRQELALYPALFQLNGKFTTHTGIAATWSYHLTESFAVNVTPLFNYANRQTDFAQEVLLQGHQRPDASTALLLDYGVVAGIEVQPIYGKFALYDGLMGRFSFVLQAGLGVGMTRVELNPNMGTLNAAFGSVGPKMLGTVGAGFRVNLGERWALRLEVRDFIYTATVGSINGCSQADLQKLENDPGASVSGSCRASAFPDATRRRYASDILESAGSDVINNLQFFGGLSFLF